MKDTSKTKAQLIEELGELRRELRRLKATIGPTKRLQEQLLSCSREWRITVDGLSAAIALIDQEGRLQRCNRAMADLLDKSFQEIVGCFMADLLDRCRRITKPEVFTFPPELREQSSCTTRQGRRWYDADVIPIRHTKRKISGAVFIIADVTERKQAEAVTEQYTEKLRALSIRMLGVEETERQRLARELHDRVGQSLTALGINLNHVRGQLSTETGKRAGHRLDDALEQIEELSANIRNVMSELRPAVLDDYGLVAALRWFGEGYAKRTSIQVQVRGEDISPRLPSDHETALFRAAQEAFTNIAKHAQASLVTVNVTQDDDEIRLDISDDGVGFNAARLRGPGKESGWGMMTMRERAESLSGSFDITSRPGDGTTVSIAIPVPDEA